MHLPPTGLTNGCHCATCREQHRVRQATYRAKTKQRIEEERAELAELRAWRAQLTEGMEELLKLRVWRDDVLALFGEKVNAA